MNAMTQNQNVQAACLTIQRALAEHGFDAVHQWSVRGPASITTCWQVQEWREEQLPRQLQYPGRPTKRRVKVALTSKGRGTLESEKLARLLAYRLEVGTSARLGLWVRLEGSEVHIEWAVPEITEVRPWHFRSSKWWELPIGLDALNRPVVLNIKETASLLLVGPTRGGKTTTARTLLYGLLRPAARNNVWLAIISGKAYRDFRGLEAAPNLIAMCDGSNNFEIGARILEFAMQLLIERRAKDVTDPPFILFADDFFNLREARPDFAPILKQLFAQGAQFGIRIWIGTQRDGLEGGVGSMISGNIDARLVVGAASANDSYLFTKVPGLHAEWLRILTGDALWLDGTGRVQHVQVANTTREDLENLLAHVQGPRSAPELSTPDRAAAPAAVQTRATVLERYRNDARLPLHQSDPTEADQEIIREVWAATGQASNMAIQILWGRRSGGKNGEWTKGKNLRTSRWLAEAVGQVVEEEAEAEPVAQPRGELVWTAS